MENQPLPPPTKFPVFTVIFFALFGIVLGTWLYFTPDGLLGKMDALGYAVCHRIGSHSFFMGEREFPLCARCTGMHLGALLGLVYQIRLGKKGGMPSLKLAISFGIFLFAFGFDGVNSYLHFFPNFPGFYDPQNWLRLLTGTLLGVGITAVLYPVFNQTVWKEWENKPALKDWKQLFILILGVALIDLSILSGNPLLQFPLMILSGLDILIILAMIYCIVWVMITRKENRYEKISDLLIPFSIGLCIAILQIGMMDLIRFIFTGTWLGFNL